VSANNWGVVVGACWVVSSNRLAQGGVGEKRKYAKLVVAAFNG
jgi:hypothetical protein